MPPIKLKNMDMRVYPPLLDGAPPADPEPQPDARRPSWRKVIAAGWYICVASFYLAVTWTLLTAPAWVQEYCTSPWQPLAVLYVPALLWGVTILVWRWSCA